MRRLLGCVLAAALIAGPEGLRGAENQDHESAALPVQILGKVQRPGNYPGDLPLCTLLAEALDRAPGSNFKIRFFNGADRSTRILRYEDVVKGKINPRVPPGSILYFPASAGALLGEMTERQMNIVYILAITLGALGLSAIARQQ